MISIRKASQADAHDIAIIQTSSWYATYRGLVCDNFLDNFTATSRIAPWQQILGESDSVFIAVEDNQAIGFAHYSATRDADSNSNTTAELTSIYIHPEHYRKGVGSLLINAVENALKGEDFSAVTLWALKGNDGAHQFYLHAGFEPDGSESYLERIKATAIRYQKRIQNR
ncbi:GNAT family N-acetyltransferase [Veronia nyctiphanis]|uniref:GNAT family N-acetyltransferase n=1 Tax=Veronia nyctiphanis TaxID=1278244 RepID=UPI0013758DC6|nr:GNAT family N-acetyltransferase [Veronia nyctiphanis]